MHDVFIIITIRGKKPSPFGGSNQNAVRTLLLVGTSRVPVNAGNPAWSTREDEQGKLDRREFYRRIDVRASIISRSLTA